MACAGAWGLAEVLGWRHLLNESPRQARAFYVVATAGLGDGALAVDVEVVNACLLPVVLGFLLAWVLTAVPGRPGRAGDRRHVPDVLLGAQP